jgi:C4-dicarboxylate-specific signal transduction histidine kinase
VLKPLRALLEAGVEGSPPRTGAHRLGLHRVRALNALSLVAGGAAVCTVFVAVVMERWEVIPGTVALIAVLVGVFWMQKRQHYFAAALFMTLMSVAVVTAQVILLEREYGVHYWYLPLILLPFLYFPPPANVAPTCLGVLSLVLILLAGKWDQVYYGLSAEHFNTLALAAGFVLLLGIAFRRYQLRAEQHAEEYQSSIEQQTRDLARFPEEDPNTVLRLARDGTVLYANEPARGTILAALGIEVGGSLPEQAHSDMRRFLDAGEPVAVDREIRGRCYHLSIQPVPKRDYINVYGVDITERREIQTALHEAQDELIRAERLAGLGIVAAGVAHEIRNPLQAVLALGESISEDGDLTRIHEDAEEIVSAAQRIAAIVNDLSSYSRSARSSEISAVQLDEVIRTALGMARRARRMNRVDVVEDYAPGCFVRANGSELIQVVNNFINNAVDAMGAVGKLTLTTGQDHDSVWLAVSDNGHGIDEAMRRQIFQPFFTTKPAGEGTGLGLYVSQRILENHSASLELDSAPGEGTTFRVLFPKDSA